MLDSKKYFKYRKDTLTKNTNNLVDTISKHWQIFSFAVVLLGYIIFSYYMQINGFSYIIPDIGQIIGMGLFLSTILLLILFFTKFDLDEMDKLFFTAVITYIIYLTTEKPPSSILLLAIASSITGIIMQHSYEQESSKIRYPKNGIIIYILYICLLLFMLTVADESTLLVYILVYLFLNAFDTIKRDDNNIFKNFIIIAFIMFSPYIATNYIDKHGISMMNFAKKNIKCQAIDRNISGVLIYQNDKYLYVHDGNLSLEIQKSSIKGDIIYKKYQYESNPTFDTGIDFPKILRKLFKF